MKKKVKDKNILTKTLHFKIKDSGKKWLDCASVEANQVYNWANQTSSKAIRKYNGKPTWLSSFDLNKLSSGSTKSKDNPDGFSYIGADSIQLICQEYVTRRIQFKKYRLRWRKSFGVGKALGWVPFKQNSITLTGLKKETGKEIGEEKGLITKKTTIKFAGKNFKIYNLNYLSLYVNTLQGKLKQGNFAQDSLGNWYINISVDIDKNLYLDYLVDKDILKTKGREINKNNNKQFFEIAKNEVVGIDLGCKSTATTSDGRKLELSFYRANEHKIALLQRNGRLKQVKYLHKKIKNRRSDVIHKFSNDLIKDFQIIKVGDLKIKQLVRRKKSKSKKDKEDNKTEIKAKNKTLKAKRVYGLRLGKSLLDGGAGLLKAQLLYKGNFTGRSVEVVNERYTTQVCSNCDHFTGPKGLKQLVVRKWVCSFCHKEHDRDVCSGENIARVKSGTSLILSVPRCRDLLAEKEKSVAGLSRKQVNRSFDKEKPVSLIHKHRHYLCR